MSLPSIYLVLVIQNVCASDFLRQMKRKFLIVADCAWLYGVPHPTPILPRELFDRSMVRMLELHRKPWQITKHARGLRELLASPRV